MFNNHNQPDDTDSTSPVGFSWIQPTSKFATIRAQLEKTFSIANDDGDCIDKNTTDGKQINKYFSDLVSILPQLDSSEKCQVAVFVVAKLLQLVTIQQETNSSSSSSFQHLFSLIDVLLQLVHSASKSTPLEQQTLYDILCTQENVGIVLKCFSKFTIIRDPKQVEHIAQGAFSQLCRLPQMIDALNPSNKKISAEHFFSQGCDKSSPSVFATPHAAAALPLCLPFALAAKDTSLPRLMAYLIANPAGHRHFFASPSASCGARNNKKMQEQQQQQQEAFISAVVEHGITGIKPGMSCGPILRILLSDVLLEGLLLNRQQTPQQQERNQATFTLHACNGRAAALVLAPLARCCDAAAGDDETLANTRVIEGDRQEIIQVTGEFLNAFKDRHALVRNFFLPDTDTLYDHPSMQHSIVDRATVSPSRRNQVSERTTVASSSSSSSSSNSSSNNKNNGSGVEDPFATFWTVCSVFNHFSKLSELSNITMYLSIVANVVVSFGFVVGQREQQQEKVSTSSSSSSLEPTPTSNDSNSLLVSARSSDCSSQGKVILDNDDDDGDNDGDVVLTNNTNNNYNQFQGSQLRSFFHRQCNQSKSSNLEPPIHNRLPETFLFGFFKVHDHALWNAIVKTLFLLERPTLEAARAYAEFVACCSSHSTVAQSALACHKPMNCLLQYINGVIDPHLRAYKPRQPRYAIDGVKIVEVVCVMVDALNAQFKDSNKAKRVFSELLLNELKEVFTTIFVLLDGMSQSFGNNNDNNNNNNNNINGIQTYEACCGSLFDKVSSVLIQLLFFNRYGNNSNNHALDGTHYCGHHRKIYNAKSVSAFVQMKRAFVEDTFLSKYVELGSTHFGGKKYLDVMDLVKDYQRDTRN